jgi:hypothetical protein
MPDSTHGVLAFLVVEAEDTYTREQKRLVVRAWFSNMETFRKQRDKLYGVPFHGLNVDKLVPFSGEGASYDITWIDIYEIRADVDSDDTLVDVLIVADNVTWRRTAIEHRLYLRRSIDYWLTHV